MPRDKRFETGYGVPRQGNAEPVRLIVVHQTGNRRKDSTAKANLNHSFKTKSWSIHGIVDATGIYEAVPLDQIAWHVLEPRIAAKLGYPVSAPGRENRGDVCAVGVEICVNRLQQRAEGDLGQKTIPGRFDDDGWPGVFESPSRTLKLGPRTYRNAVRCVARLAAAFPDAKIVGHGHLDPWTRNTDPFGVLPHGWGGFLADVHKAESRLHSPVTAIHAPELPSPPKMPVPPVHAPLSKQASDKLRAAERLIEEVRRELAQ